MTDKTWTAHVLNAMLSPSAPGGPMSTSNIILDQNTEALPDKAMIKDTTTKDFMDDVIKASAKVPVVVDFWSPNCGPCKQLTPVLEKYIEKAEGELKLVKMNIDEHPAIFSQLAMQLGLQSIPAIVVFKDGQPVDGFMGALPESQIQTFLGKFSENVLGNDIEAVFETADGLYEENDFETAQDVYASILEEDKDNLRAKAGLAKCYIKQNNIDDAKALLETVPPEKKTNADVAAAFALLEIEEMSASTGDLADLKTKVEHNPNDPQIRFDLAIAYNADGQKQEALDTLLDLIGQHKSWNDEAAKKQLVKFFEAWGPKDPLTIQGRKRLSLLLFS